MVFCDERMMHTSIEIQKEKPVLQRIGKTQQKILLLLLGGLTIGLSGSPRTAFKVIRAVHAEWKEIDHKGLRQSIKTLHNSGFVVTRTRRDGTTSLILSNEGRRLAVAHTIDRLAIKRLSKWDKHWRIVMFDIPEDLRRVRNSFRFQMKRLGFLELQKSVFVHPYPCGKEIEYLSDFYRVRKFVRLVVAISIDNERELMRSFHL